MCIDWIELLLRIFLISPHLKVHVCWKDVLHQPVNNILIFQKKNISSIWPQILITVSSADHIQYLNDVLKPTLPYSWRLSTAGTTLLFTRSVNSTNFSVHIPSVTVLNQDTLQHLHTQHCISQTVLSELKVTSVLKNWYICKYISYHEFTFKFLMEERESDSRLIIFYHWKASYAYIKLRHVKSPVHLPMMTFEFYVDLIFRQHCDTTIDPASNRSKIKGCLLGIKQEFAQDWQPYQLHLPTV